MKTNRTLIISIIIFLCLICFIIGGIGYFYFANLPPTALADSGYYIRITKVYYHPGFGLSSPFEIKDVHMSTFEILDDDRGYAKDKNRVYLDGLPIPEADPATFEILEDRYWRDKNYVYLNERIFSNDPENFEFISGNLMRDSHHIYWSTEIISDDPSNFTIIDDSGSTTYWKDSQNIFFNGSPIEDANINTFEIIDDIYSHDDTNVFYRADTISQADIASFEVVEMPYAKDDFSVFHMEHILPNADPQTFYILNIKFRCTADSQTAYYQNIPIPNFDPNTIPSDSIVTNCDETRMYFSP
jgi:hypothetical protein